MTTCYSALPLHLNYSPLTGASGQSVLSRAGNATGPGDHYAGPIFAAYNSAQNPRSIFAPSPSMKIFWGTCLTQKVTVQCTSSSTPILDYFVKSCAATVLFLPCMHNRIVKCFQTFPVMTCSKNIQVAIILPAGGKRHGGRAFIFGCYRVRLIIRHFTKADLA